MGLRDDILAFRPYNEQEETEKRLMLQYMDTFPDLRDGAFYSLLLDRESRADACADGVPQSLPVVGLARRARGRRGGSAARGAAGGE